jgi:hypothetical protein
MLIDEKAVNQVLSSPAYREVPTLIAKNNFWGNGSFEAVV